MIRARTRAHSLIRNAPVALSPNARASLLMSASMAAFVINDAMTKHLSASINMGQVMFMRGLFATAFIFLLAWRAGVLRRVSGVFSWPVIIRALCDIAATVTFLVALARIPLGNASAILQALPLAVTMGASLYLHEPVGWRRWSAIALGFVGVTIILRPGPGGFDGNSLLIVATVFFCAVRDIATRLVPAHVPSLQVSAMTSASVTLTGALITGPMGGWRPMDAEILGYVAAAAGFVVAGYLTIIMAMRCGEVSAAAPFRYTALVWALVLGYVAFGEVPDMMMIVGASIVVASGLFTLYREHRLPKAIPVAAASTGRTGARGI